VFTILIYSDSALTAQKLAIANGFADRIRIIQGYVYHELLYIKLVTLTFISFTTF